MTAWISVKERLPAEYGKPSGDVLVWAGDHGVRIGWVDSVGFWTVEGSIRIGECVTHWMPLPEPPQANTSGGK